MTEKQYEIFRKALEKKGYKKWSIPNSIHNESFYYYKGFAYDKDNRPGYQILFLVWDLRNCHSVPDSHPYGVTPHILTESHEWSRIDLEMMETKMLSISKVEEYAYHFYFNFALIHGL